MASRRRTELKRQKKHIGAHANQEITKEASSVSPGANACKDDCNRFDLKETSEFRTENVNEAVEKNVLKETEAALLASKSFVHSAVNDKAVSVVPEIVQGPLDEMDMSDTQNEAEIYGMDPRKLVEKHAKKGSAKPKQPKLPSRNSDGFRALTYSESIAACEPKEMARVRVEDISNGSESDDAYHTKRLSKNPSEKALPKVRTHPLSLVREKSPSKPSKRAEKTGTGGKLVKIKASIAAKTNPGQLRTASASKVPDISGSDSTNSAEDVGKEKEYSSDELDAEIQRLKMLKRKRAHSKSACNRLTKKRDGKGQNAKAKRQKRIRNLQVNDS